MDEKSEVRRETMGEEKGKQQQITQEQVKELAGKLQTFYDGLPADEKPVLEAVLKSAAGPETDVTGYSAQRGVTGYGDTSIEKGPPVELFLADGTFQMNLGQPAEDPQAGGIWLYYESNKVS